MHESTPRQPQNIEEIRAKLDERLESMRRAQTAEQDGEALSANQPDEAINQNVEPEKVDTLAETLDTATDEPSSESEQYEIESELKRLHDAQENLNAERQRVLDKAAEDAERLRAQAEELERQREAEIAAEAEKQQREIDAEIERRRVEAERQKVEEAQRLEAEAEAIRVRAAAAEAERQRVVKVEAQERAAEIAAAEEAAKLAPPTLEQPQVKGPQEQQIAEVTKLPTKKRRVLPVAAVVASCVSITAGGVAVVTGNDGEVANHAKSLIGLTDSNPGPNPSVKRFTAKLPEGFINKLKITSRDTPRRKAEKSETPPQAKKEAPKKHVAPMPTVAITQSRQTVQAPELKSSDTSSTTKKTSANETENTSRPKADRDDTSNKGANTATEPSGGASYGNTPTTEGGASPYVSKASTGR